MKVDYGKIELPALKTAKYQSGQLPVKAAYDLKVLCKLLNKSMSQIVSTAIVTYLEQNSEQHTEYIDFLVKEGKTREDIYLELALGEDSE